MARVRILRAAVLEASSASDWYAERDAMSAEQFRIALDETVASIVALPGIGQLLQDESSVRRARLRRFPWWVIYEEGDGVITILAVMHEKRRPGYWREP